jgi:Na+/H+-dicarboxylate symporter
MKRRIPLALQVLMGVALGVLLGALAGKSELTETLGAIGILSIKALRALAVPLVFFAILDAFVKTRIEARKFGRLLLICLVNVSVAMGIGLTILNVFQPGKLWRGQLESLIAQTHAKAPEVKKADDPEAPGATLELLPNVSYYVPSSLVKPFVYWHCSSEPPFARCAQSKRRMERRASARSRALWELPIRYSW